jgi:hypothetical protein
MGAGPQDVATSAKLRKTRRVDEAEFLRLSREID